jgi:hypothetical protein
VGLDAAGKLGGERIGGGREMAVRVAADEGADGGGSIGVAVW